STSSSVVARKWVALAGTYERIADLPLIPSSSQPGWLFAVACATAVSEMRLTRPETRTCETDAFFAQISCPASTCAVLPLLATRRSQNCNPPADAPTVILIVL